MNNKARTALRELLLCGVGVAATAIAFPAMAQDQPASGDATPSQNDGAGIAEVVVTARRRVERLVDVPVAATSLGTEGIERYNSVDLQSLAANVPGLVLNKDGGGGSGGSFSIRGVGNLSRDFGTEQPVALNIDGVQITRGRIASVGLFDVNRVEVLKGPQALFFGKNSPAGVVSITSQDPEERLGGYARGSYEFALHTWLAEAAINIPVSDVLRLRIAGRYSKMTNGYLKNVAGSTTDPFTPNPVTGLRDLPTGGSVYKTSPNPEQGIVRFAALYTPTDKLRISLKALVSRETLNTASLNEIQQCGSPSGPQIFGVVDPYADCSGDYRRTASVIPPAIGAASKYAPVDLKPFNRTDNALVSLAINYGLGAIDLTSVTGMYWSRNSAFDDYTITSFGQSIGTQNEKSRQFTQEFRAATNFGGPVNFTAGAFYQNDHRTLLTANRFPGQAFSTAAQAAASTDPQLNPADFTGIGDTQIGRSVNDGRVYSLFGQARWKIIPTVELAAGARWTKEQKTAELGSIYNRLALFSPAGYYYKPSIENSNVSPEVTLSWKPDRDITTYVAYKTGFLSGGVQTPQALTNIHGTCLRTSPADVMGCENNAITYKPQSVKGFEGGVKGYLFDRKLFFDFNVYTYEFRNLQVSNFDTLTTAFIIQNAGGSKSRGAELQLQYKVNSDLQLRTSLAYTDLKYTTYSTGPCQDAQPIQAFIPNDQRQAYQCYAILGTTSGERYLNGTRYGNSPFQAILGVDYTAALGSDLKLDVSADQYYYSRQPRATSFAVGGEEHWLTSAAVRLHPDDNHWEVALIGTNLFNDYWTPVTNSKPLGFFTTTSGDMLAAPQLPRQVTLQLTARF